MITLTKRQAANIRNWIEHLDPSKYTQGQSYLKQQDRDLVITRYFTNESFPEDEAWFKRVYGLDPKIFSVLYDAYVPFKVIADMLQEIVSSAIIK